VREWITRLEDQDVSASTIADLAAARQAGRRRCRSPG
jgi:hypothetical protein